MIKVNNERELLRLLSLISEEAVSVSRKRLNEISDPYVDEYEKQYEEDQGRFGSLSEQEEELPVAGTVL